MSAAPQVARALAMLLVTIAPTRPACAIRCAGIAARVRLVDHASRRGEACTARLKQRLDLVAGVHDLAVARGYFVAARIAELTLLALRPHFDDLEKHHRGVGTVLASLVHEYFGARRVDDVAIVARRWHPREVGIEIASLVQAHLERCARRVGDAAIIALCRQARGRTPRRRTSSSCARRTIGDDDGDDGDPPRLRPEGAA